MRVRRLLRLAGTILLLAAIPLIVRASPGEVPAPTGNVPTTICYQGTLSDPSGAPVHGPVNMVFSIYEVPAGGVAVWTETQNVSVSSGYFNVYLGDVQPLSYSVFSGATPLYLGVRVAADAEMIPRTRVASVPYAFGAQAAPPCGGALCSGRCVVLASDPLNCGTCGNVCPTYLNTIPACGSGTCGFICSGGFANCDTNAGTGCEININTDANNCGSCGHICTAANGTPVCTNGLCGVQSCNAGYANCDNDPSNGCEVDLATDVNNCNSCGTVCGGVPNGTPGCSNSTCGVGSCNVGWGNCNGLSGDGCEMNVFTNLSNCGTCSHACSTNNCSPACTSGACNIVSCTSPWKDCNSSATDGCEINTTNDINNCATCNHVCPTYPYATSSCVNSSCSWACNTYRSNCDGNLMNGCEIDWRTDNHHCGNCSTHCTSPQTCQGGICK
jgi:hypothetical protein